MSEFGSTVVPSREARSDSTCGPAVSGTVTSALPRYCHFWYDVSARSARYCTVAVSTPSTNSACRPGVLGVPPMTWNRYWPVRGTVTVHSALDVGRLNEPTSLLPEARNFHPPPP